MHDPVMVEIRLFGGVEVTGEGARPVDLGPAKCQTVLAALALSPRAAVPVARLVEMVWGERPPRTADKTLQSYVTRLRKGLGPDSIVRIGSAYRLDIDPEAVDVARFQRLLAAGDVEAALAEWTGTPLAGLDDHGLTATVDALLEQWLGAIEAHLAHRVETEASAVIGSLTELTASHPFREGLWALLMTALYRVGRQADALAAYRRARHHLVEELGVEPGPRLRELESSILGHDEQLTVDGPPGGPALGLPTGTVTFGFTDVESSTRLWSSSREEAAAAMARHDSLVRSLAERHGGYVFATGGESFGVAFHRATDAAAWATELQAAMQRELWPGGVDLRVRIGLHTGETQERAKGYFGPAVLVAARLASIGHGGQTLVSEVTAALLDGPDGIGDRRDLGTYRLEGVVAEHRIMQLGEGDHPPLRTEEGRRGNLPRRLGRLIGRDEDLEIVVDVLATSPVVTLVGPGGIGKTRLGVAAARRAEVDFRGGAWLVELAAIAASSDVPRAVAEVLGVREASGQSVTQAIVAFLQPRRALLVLDNCEHIVDGVAELTRAVVEGCPNVRVLATSREGLGLGNGHEQLIAVGPLDPAGPGVELFDERASAASRSFDLHASREHVEAICRRLDGVPLAIELAAARTRSISPAELVERLDDRLRLLTGGRRTSVERHRTLRATIDWSYELLTPPEQLLFQRLSIFAGPFDLAAAETVAGDPELGGLDERDVDDLLGSLVDRSMVIVESGPFGSRYRLLETMRQFAAEHLYASDHTDLVAGHHARWCRDRVVHIRELLAGPAEIEAVARLDELWPNLRAAVEWACATGDRHLARALVEPIATEVYVRSQSEIGDWAERILAITPPDDEDTTTFGLIWAARRYMRHLDLDGYERLVGRYGEPDHPMIRYARAFIEADYDRMPELARKALLDLRQRAEPLHRARTPTGRAAASAGPWQEDHYVADLFEVAGLGFALMMAGRLEEHDELLMPRVERYRQDGPPTCLSWVLAYLGISASLQGRRNEAWQRFDDLARVAVPDGTHSLKNPFEARAALRRGDRQRAFQLMQAYLQELLDHDNLYLAHQACAEFVGFMLHAGRLAEAAAVLDYLEGTAARHSSDTYRQLVADARHKLGAHRGPLVDHEAGPIRDDRAALTYMCDALGRLAATGDG